MRIISQDKEFDLPYEETTLQAFDNGKIGAFSLTDLESNAFIIMAEYSTKEKAIKAMEMCRKKYADSEYNRSALCGMVTQIGMLTNDIAEVFKDGICDKFTFRFPEDEEVKRAERMKWIPCNERFPEDESYILVSFENSTMPDIARYEENDEGGTFYPGDDEKSYSSYGFFVNAWMPLPKPYKEVEDGN